MSLHRIEPVEMSKKSKLGLGALLLVVIVGYAVLNYAYKPHQTVDERDIKFTGTATEFSITVAKDAAPWQDVVVQLTGTITATDANGFTLNNNTYCQVSDTKVLATLNNGQNVTVKARMIGYDDLLEELKLDQTKIIK